MSQKDQPNPCRTQPDPSFASFQLLTRYSTQSGQLDRISSSGYVLGSGRRMHGSKLVFDHLHLLDGTPTSVTTVAHATGVGVYHWRTHSLHRTSVSDGMYPTGVCKSAFMADLGVRTCLTRVYLLYFILGYIWSVSTTLQDARSALVGTSAQSEAQVPNRTP